MYLDREGASDLVAELVMKSSLSPNVFMEAVQLGIALLENGNPVIQRSLFTKLQSAETSPIFFKVKRPPPPPTTTTTKEVLIVANR